MIERRDPLSYIVQMKSGALWRRHIDQLRECLGRAEVNAKPTSSEVESASMYDVGGTAEENTHVEPKQTSETVEDTRDDAPSEKPSETTLVEAPECESARHYP